MPPLQARKVQELVVEVIRQFTAAYGPLVLVLGEWRGCCSPCAVLLPACQAAVLACGRDAA